MEKWKAIKNIEGVEVSNEGRVRSSWHGLASIVREPQRHPSGFLYIPIRRDGKQINLYLHKEIARVFVSNPNGRKYVEHINGNRADCRAVNLAWSNDRRLRPCN